eukprot:15467624-Alexandrium_andersonii.AAC.1
MLRRGAHWKTTESAAMVATCAAKQPETLGVEQRPLSGILRIARLLLDPAFAWAARAANYEPAGWGRGGTPTSSFRRWRSKNCCAHEGPRRAAGPNLRLPSSGRSTSSRSTTRGPSPTPGRNHLPTGPGAPAGAATRSTRFSLHLGRAGRPG